MSTDEDVSPEGSGESSNIDANALHKKQTADCNASDFLFLPENILNAIDDAGH